MASTFLNVMNEDDNKFYCKALKDAKQNQYTKEQMKN